jgi:predicted MFS family arabinose efflux permease
MPRADLSAGLAFNAVLFNVARFVGPAIAGAVIVAGGAEAAFFLNALTYLVLVWALWAIDVPLQPRERGRRRDMLSQIGAGYSYVSHHPGIGPLLLIFAASTILVRPVTELLPGFADGVFGRGAQGLAWMSSMVGLGAILGGIALIRSNTTARLVRAAIGSILLLCVSIIAFVFVPSYWAALALLFAFGFGTSTGGISAQTLVQTALDDAMRGRVMSLYGALFRGGPAIGALMMGTASDHFGLQIPVAIGAGFCLLVALWAVTQRRKLVVHLHKPLTETA